MATQVKRLSAWLHVPSSLTAVVTDVHDPDAVIPGGLVALRREDERIIYVPFQAFEQGELLPAAPQDVLRVYAGSAGETHV